MFFPSYIFLLHSSVPVSSGKFSFGDLNKQQETNSSNNEHEEDEDEPQPEPVKPVLEDDAVYTQRYYIFCHPLS